MCFCRSLCGPKALPHKLIIVINLYRGVSMAQSQNNRQLRKDCAAILESMKVSILCMHEFLDATCSCTCVRLTCLCMTFRK